MIAFFSQDKFLGSTQAPDVLPSYHFFCPSCGDIWARLICEPGNYHRVVDDRWCPNCARANEQGIWDGVIDVYWFPEFRKDLPLLVLIHNFLQLYDNRVRLDSAGVPTKSSIKYRPDNSELLARLKETA